MPRQLPIDRQGPPPSSRFVRSLAAAVSLAVGAAGLLASSVGAQSTTARRLSLGEAVRLAAQRNAAVAAAQYRAEQADARVRQRRADLLPTFSALAIESGHTLNTATFGFDFGGSGGGPALFDPAGELLGPVNTLDLRAKFSQSLLDVGARERVSAARAAAVAGDDEAVVAQEQAAAAAAIAYVRALRADAQVTARRADSSLAGDLLGIAQDQLQAGVGIALDVTRARAQVAQIRAQLIQARTERDRSLLELSRVLSFPVDTLIVLSDSLAGLAMPGSEATAADVERALQARPDLRGIESQITSVDKQVRAARMDRLPSVSAFADNGPIARNGRNYINTYAWGVQLTVPIFDGFKREARIEEQVALRKEYEARRRDLRQQVSLDVRGAQLELASTREQLEAARERLSLADQELVLARDRFRAGVAGNADVVTASLNLNAARTLVIDVLASFQLARVSLARAVGAARQLQ